MPVKKAGVDETLKVLVAGVVAENPELRARVQKIVELSLGSVEQLLKFGSSSDRIAIAKTIVPHMMRSMSTAETNEAEIRKVEAFERVMKQVRDGGTNAVAAPAT